jgi:hypothetical protein
MMFVTIYVKALDPLQFNNVDVGERAKTGGFGVGIMIPNGATCLHVDCCFSE